MIKPNGMKFYFQTESKPNMVILYIYTVVKKKNITFKRTTYINVQLEINPTDDLESNLD